ncbi:hypothetical protein L484_028052 [Morus notabilis]|uniref:Uncharacterized protein n=1 Tax=Morus notabilis TaxID=981085 RepID=W9SFY8_9ROSA|nr:hypothetical protein L484_028052 [Morus notabilis]
MASDGNLKTWVSDKLMSLLGYSQSMLVLYVIKLSKQATSPADVVSSRSLKYHHQVQHVHLLRKSSTGFHGIMLEIVVFHMEISFKLQILEIITWVFNEQSNKFKKQIHTKDTRKKRKKFNRDQRMEPDLAGINRDLTLPGIEAPVKLQPDLRKSKSDDEIETKTNEPTKQIQ